MSHIAVVQAVLLYGLEMWVMPPRIWMTLGGFQYRVAHRLMGRKLQRGLYGTWIYSPLTEAM